MVEKQKALGGTCLLWGCIPTKALLEHAHALKVVQHAKDWGVTPRSGAPCRIDMTQVQARKDRVVTGLTKGVEFLFKKNKIDWIKGTARLTGNGGVDVFEGDTQTLRARKEIIVATGSSPRGVPGIVIDRKRIITSDEAIGLREVPKTMLIMGSGAVGVEFASIFNRFGSDVTIVELLPRLVPVEDEAVSAELEKSFRKQGITSHHRREGDAAPGRAATAWMSTCSSQTATHEEDSRRLPAGRDRARAGDRGLNAEGVGLQMEKGYIKVDAAVPDERARDLGDWRRHHAGRTGTSAARARVVGGRHHHRGADRGPGDAAAQLRSRAGVHLLRSGDRQRRPDRGEARARGYDVRVGTFPFGVLGRAKMAGETDGFVKIVAEKKYDELLGVHMIGPRSTELVAEATVALRLESTVEELIRTIHAHPTMAEAIGEAAHAAHGAAIHSWDLCGSDNCGSSESMRIRQSTMNPQSAIDRITRLWLLTS